MIMARTPAAVSDPLSLLRGALRAPHDRGLLESVRNEREAINAVLRRSDVEVPELADEGLDPMWTAVVITALETVEISPMAMQLVALRIADEREDGLRFAALVNRLPESLASFETFGHLPAALPEVQARIAASPAAIAAGAAAKRPARYGLSPLTFFSAAQVISNVLSNSLRDPAFAKSGQLLDELALESDCGKAVAEAMASWLMNAAVHEADLIPGFSVGADLSVRPIEVSAVAPVTFEQPDELPDLNEQDERLYET
jgi:hypothetical protein